MISTSSVHDSVIPLGCTAAMVTFVEVTGDGDREGGSDGVGEDNTLEAINAMAHNRLYHDVFSKFDVEEETVLV